MINTSFRKILVQYLHPFAYITQFGTFQGFQGNRGQGSPRRYNSPRSYSYSDRDFKNYCRSIPDQRSQIIKDILTLPQMDEATLNLFRKTNHCLGPLRNVVQNFEFLSKEVQQILNDNGITAPTLIQQAIIPSILNGQDVIAIAETGSGKTLAFALPGIMHIQAQPKSDAARVLVLAPTRELAQQIQKQYNLFLRTACLFGGQQKSHQYRDLVERPEVIIATPGRLQDLMNEGLPLSGITQVVLDEADRMLDMGFEEPIRNILKEVRDDRQTLFFSATWPQQVQRLAESLCQQNPQLLQLGQGGLSVNKMIQQNIIIAGRQKFDQFLDLINEVKEQKLLIFCQRKMDTQKLEYKLSENNVNARYLHGDLSQRERDNILNDFRSGRIQCLITTNLASRGLDVQDVDIVINYDFPDTIEDYIHRIGRTGRAGKKGKAVSFIEPRFLSYRMKKQIIEVFKSSNQVVPQDFMSLRAY